MYPQQDKATTQPLAVSFWSRIQSTQLHQCSGQHVRFGNIPHGLPAQSPVPPVTSILPQRATEHQQHQSLEQTGEQRAERQAALQQASPVGVSEVQNRIQDSPSGWKHSLQPWALCRGERGGKGFLVRGQHCCLWRICLPQGVFQQRA